MGRQPSMSATNNIPILKVKPLNLTAFSTNMNHENLGDTWRDLNKTHLPGKTDLDSVMKLCTSDWQPRYKGPWI